MKKSKKQSAGSVVVCFSEKPDASRAVCRFLGRNA